MGLFLCAANDYRESACVAAVAALRECCERLPPEVLRYSVHCAGVVRKK